MNTNSEPQRVKLTTWNTGGVGHSDENLRTLLLALLQPYLMGMGLDDVELDFDITRKDTQDKQQQIVTIDVWGHMDQIQQTQWALCGWHHE